MRFIYLLVTAIILVALFAGIKDSVAHDWFTGYKNKTGMDCCGINDCVRVKKPVIHLGDRFVIKGREVTVNILHPSQDVHNWVCVTGCAFVQGVAGYEDNRSPLRQQRQSYAELN